jgi:hypothetical protein
MQIDELRSGLTTLSDEMEPFEGDVRVLHRRERRRRVVTASIAVVLVVAGISTAAYLRHDDARRVQVIAPSPKAMAPGAITRVDVVVVPANLEVAALLDASPMVARYAHVARLPATLGALASTDARAALCAVSGKDGFAVQVTSPGPGVGGALSRVFAGRAEAHALRFYGDIEVFLTVGASRSQVDSVHNAVYADGDIAHARFVGKQEAYAIFRRDFANQPPLVKSTKPSDLPESIFITLRDGKSVDAVRQRYQRLAGVDTVLTNVSAKLIDPATQAQFGQFFRSACAQP